MPSPTAVGVLLTSSLRLSGAVAVGETPSADEMAQGILDLNDLLEILSLQNLALYTSLPEAFTTVAGKASYTIGVGGDWNTQRPVRIGGTPICNYNGVDFEIDVIGLDEYQGIPLKTQQQPIIEKLAYVNDGPLGTIYLWPTPLQAITVTINPDRLLTQVTDSSTVMIYPPGYLLAFRYTLAVMHCGAFGIPCPPEVSEIAKSAMAAVKRANKVKRRMDFDQSLVSTGPTVWQTGGV